MDLAKGRGQFLEIKDISLRDSHAKNSVLQGTMNRFSESMVPAFSPCITLHQHMLRLALDDNF